MSNQDGVGILITRPRDLYELSTNRLNNETIESGTNELLWAEYQ
jgi:hypothetical protein